MKRVRSFSVFIDTPHKYLVLGFIFQICYLEAICRNIFNFCKFYVTFFFIIEIITVRVLHLLPWRTDKAISAFQRKIVRCFRLCCGKRYNCYFLTVSALPLPIYRLYTDLIFFLIYQIFILEGSNLHFSRRCFSYFCCVSVWNLYFISCNVFCGIPVKNKACASCFCL